LGIEDTAGATLVEEEKRGGRGDREQGGGVMGRGGVKGGSDCVPRGFSLRRGRSDGSSAVFFKPSSAAASSVSHQQQRRQQSALVEFQTAPHFTADNRAGISKKISSLGFCI
jgi:hypothetical protein